MNLSKNSTGNTPADQPVAEGSSRKRQLLMLGGGALALLAVGGMAFVLLTGGDDAAPESALVKPATSVGAATTAPTGTPTATAGAIKKYTGKDARDPFKPLVVVQAASTGAATTASTSAATTATDPSTATATSSGGVTISPPITTTGPPVKPTTTLTMASVRADNTSATLTVNAKKYTVRKDQKFATNFKLLDMDNGSCAAIQYGDVTFDLCEGQTRTVS